MNTFGKISIVSAATSLPAALLVSGLVSWQLKSANSDNVDITQGLAYLRPILITGAVVFILLIGASIVSGVISFKKENDKTIAKLGLTLAALILVLSASVAVVNSKNSNVVDSYREQKEQQFFDKLSN